MPNDVRKAYGKGEVVRSLGNDPKEFAQKARLLHAAIYEEWKLLRQGDRSVVKPHAVQESNVVDETAPIRSTAAQRIAAPVFVRRLSAEDVSPLVAKWFLQARTESRSVAFAVDESEADSLAHVQSISHYDAVAHFLFEEARRMAWSERLAIDYASAEWRELLNALHAAMKEVAKRAHLLAFPDAPMSADPKFDALGSPVILQPVAKGMSLRQLVQAYRDDPTRPKLVGKTRTKREAQWRLLQDFFGQDTPVAEIGRGQVKAFVDRLQFVPSNSPKHFPKATMLEAIELAAARKLPLLATVTANGYIRQLSALFRYALAEQQVTFDPTQQITLHGPKVANKDLRYPFSSDELTKIFSAPLYTGCKDDGRGYSREGTSLPRRGRFWVPLIALFTGMRLGEVCQLTLDDFVFEDDTDVIQISGDDDGETKRVKTPAGNRFVPVHDELKRIGLLRWVDTRRRGEHARARIFPDLPVGSTGYASDPFSKFYAIFLDKLAITDDKKVFHSFRHNYRDALREADLSAERVSALGGWSTGRTQDDYGSRLKASTLGKDMKKIGYPSLDLSHLYVAST